MLHGFWMVLDEVDYAVVCWIHSVAVVTLVL